MKQTQKLRQTSILLLLAALFITGTACNGEEAPVEESDADDVRTIEITGVDQMNFVVAEETEGIVTGQQIGEEYELEQILAQPGEEISIRLESRSELPASAMSHNFILLEMDTDVDRFANESMTAPDNDYISPDMEDQVIVATDMLAGGESDTIQFAVPTEPGTYTFICSFPGHYAGGMVGEIVVE
ncbi:MAG: plastocyanin/azurin family copper-binding protein [Balneolaceae bacterium]